MSDLQIRFAQVDPGAKSDIVAVSAPDKSTWSVLDDLKYDNVPEPGDYATLEHNFWTLDGTKDIFPDDTTSKTWGLWTQSMSAENTYFVTAPTLDIVFNDIHKSPGFTFYFYPHTGDFARDVRITWYDAANAVLQSGNYTFSSDFATIYEPTEGFKRISIEFLATSLPYRYIKLYGIDIGRIRIISDEEINSCNIYEEIDPTIESISVNTFNAQIRTLEPFFSPLSNDISDEMMMKRQDFKIFQEGKRYGTFFLETWEDIDNSGIVFNFEGVDAMGVLDLYTFMGGIYNNVMASDVLNEIFRIVFPTRLIKYVLDPELADARITGWIPICTCGTAFQHIMFAINAISDTSRAGDILIYPRDTEVTYTLPLEEQYRGGNNKPTEYWSGVDVVSYNYTPGTETLEVQNGVLPVGRHEIRFSEPLHSLSIQYATILQSNANYALINVTARRAVTLTGKKYVSNPRIHSVRNAIETGETESVKSYEGYTLVNPDIGLELAESKADYFQNRIQLEDAIVLNDREVGFVVDAETRKNNFSGLITALDVNIRANKAEMTAVGKVVKREELGLTDYEYTGIFFSGEQGY